MTSKHISRSMKFKAAFSGLIWLLPASNLKNAILRFLGNTIGNEVSISPVVWMNCGPFEILDGARLAPFSVYRRLASVKIGKRATIGSWNFISAEPQYQLIHSNAGVLHLGNFAFITSRHYIDCSGAVYAADYSAIAGQRSLIQSHEIDLRRDVQTVGTIQIGERAFVSSACTLLKGSYLPARSILAAGSLLTANRDPGVSSSGLWAGSPARFIKIYEGDWFDRINSSTDIEHNDKRLTPPSGTSD